MKLLQATQTKDTKKKRKLLKSEVERHRRERMNQSLESLRALLMKGQHQPGLASRRVEKAEILEHTLRFLRNTQNAVPPKRAERQHFQDGFLACLRQATRFLKAEGEGREAGSALADTRSLHRLRLSITRLSPRPPRTQSDELSVRAPQQGCKYRPQHCAAPRTHQSPHHRATLAHTGPHDHQRRPRNASAAPCSPIFAHSQAMWRPWSSN